jgi:hypothetical protein
VPAYTVNEDAVRHAKRLSDARQYVLRSRWQDVQPNAREQNAFLKTRSWEEYAAWHLGLTEGAAEETKVRYAFVYGDFRRLHRMGLIACHYRAAEWRHKEIELAAYCLSTTRSPAVLEGRAPPRRCSSPAPAWSRWFLSAGTSGPTSARRPRRSGTPRDPRPSTSRLAASTPASPDGQVRPGATEPQPAH